MRVHIEPTSRVVELVTERGTVPARIWEGETDGGLPVICWVTRVAAKRDDDLSELDAALAEQRPPSAAAQEFPLRMIL
jgi:hypothetical protein